MTEYCPVCDNQMEYLAVSKKWHCTRCDKYFMQVVDEDEQENEPGTVTKSEYSKGKVAAVGFVVIMMLLGMIICGYMAIPM